MLDLKDTASFMYTMIVYFTWHGFGEVMHQSIPPAPSRRPPPPPPATAGHLPALSVPGVEHLHFFWAVFILRICSSAGVVTVLSRVLTVGATPFSLVLTVQASMLLAFSRTLTVGATLFSTVLTIQATMLLAFSRVLTVWATLWSTVLLFKPPLLLVL